MKNQLIKLGIMAIALILIWSWVGIEKLIERRELKELIEKNSDKNKKGNR